MVLADPVHLVDGDHDGGLIAGGLHRPLHLDRHALLESPGRIDEKQQNICALDGVARMRLHRPVKSVGRVEEAGCIDQHGLESLG